MQSYVYLILISASVFLPWVAFELLARPIHAAVRLRRRVLEQILIFKGISMPMPRETAVSSRDIREYDQTMRSVRDAQRIFHELGSQLLAFGENEHAVCIVMALFGLNIVAAGNGLIDLSEAYLEPETDRAGPRREVETALRLPGALATSRRLNPNGLIKFQTISMYLRDVGYPSET
jgi:hypothetical protein